MARLVHCERSAEERVKDFGEGYRCLTPEEAMVEARRCVRRACDVASCEIACPMRSDIRQMMQFVAGGDFTEAARVLGQGNNSADICARVCPHDMLCEGHCVLGAEDEPIAIGAVERCVAEWALRHASPQQPSPRQSGKHVAIVGSGPSGLACAEELVKKGHRVTVYEALPHPGGLLVYGIPGFKVSRTAVERRLNQVRALGVDFVCNTRIGYDFSLNELEKRGYRAIFLATGATEPNEPEIEGRHLGNVVGALPFICRNIVEPQDLPPPYDRPDCLQGKHVVVLGGGDTAMGLSRAAVRLGAERVTCIYRRDEASMPGSPFMVRCAKEEGVQFRFLAVPVRFTGNESGDVCAVECAPVRPTSTNLARCHRPVAEPGDTFTVKADFAALAFGFNPSRISGADDGLALTEKGSYSVDGSYMTSRRGVFAGAASAGGMGSVVAAVKRGYDAADAIDRFMVDAG